MTVLIADKLAASCISALEAAGMQVVNEPSLKGDTLIEALLNHRPKVLIVRSTKVPAAAIQANATLELIVRAGAGYDNVDVNTASAQGVFVANCPGKNAEAVAELAIGLLLALDRSIPDNVSDARGGRWNKALYGKASGLKGRTLGIIGLGNIGQAVAKRAQALEMEVVAWSRSLTPEKASALGVGYRATPLAVAEIADAVTLHVAATPETQALANRAFFEAMKPDAFFINTTRSSVVDEDALVWALDEKGVRAALDVFSNEPAVKTGAFEHPLAQHPSVYLTHHIGASTQQAQGAVADEAARVILTYADTGAVPNCVNMATQTPATHVLTVRHLDRVGVLAGVLDHVRQAGWNVHEMENLVFAGAKAACARIWFDGVYDEAVVATINEQADVLVASAIAL